MGSQSSRSSSTLKKTFQTFKSFTPIQRTTSTTRMKYAFATLVIACAVAAANAKEPDCGQCIDDIMDKRCPIPMDSPNGIPDKDFDPCESRLGRSVLSQVTARRRI